MSPEAFVNAIPLEEKKKFTLKDLSNLLRDPSQWPEDFVWDYTDPNHCAMGLFVQTVPGAKELLREHSTYSRTMMHYFGISRETTEDIFIYAHENARFFGLMDSKQEDVTPRRVAKLIDKYLAKAA